MPSSPYETTFSSIDIMTIQQQTFDTTNSTKAQVIDLEPIITSSISIPLNSFFMLLLIGLILFIVFFLMMRSVRESMKRNQHVMIGSVILLCLVQVSSLVCRTLYDSLNLSMVTQIHSYVYSNFNESVIVERGFDVTYMYNNSFLSNIEQAGISQGRYVAMHVFGALELFCALMNCVVMMLIMCFVDNVFLNTVRITSGLIYSKGVQRATIIVNTITILFSITLSMIIALTCIILILNRLDIVEEYQNYFFIAGYVVFVSQILIQTIVSNVSSFSSE